MSCGNSDAALVLAVPMKCDTMKCDTSNCENEGVVDVGNMVVCGRCHHGMLHGERPVTMSDDAREQARKLVAGWCDPRPPEGWTLARPGSLQSENPLYSIVVLDARTLIRIAPGVCVQVEAVDVALRSMNVGSSVALAHALEAALEDGDCLRGVIARALEASDTIADSDAEDVVQEMLKILMEPEPVGGDDRLELRGRVESQAIEWRAELDNRHLGVILMVGQIVGADGDDDPIELLRARMKESAEFEEEAWKMRDELDSQRASANERVDKLAAELTRVQGLLTDVTRERNVLRGRIDVDENDLDEAGFFDDDGISFSDPHPKILAWMAVNGFEFVEHDQQDGRTRGIWRGSVFVRPGAPKAFEHVFNDLALAVGRPPLDVLAEIVAMVPGADKPEPSKLEPGWYWCHRGQTSGSGPFPTRAKAIAEALGCGADGIDLVEVES